MVKSASHGRVVSFRESLLQLVHRGSCDNLKPPSQTALPRSCIDGIDPRYRPRRRHRHERGRHHTRHTAVPDGLGGRDRRVLHDLLASRWAQSPIGAHVVCVFGKEKL